MNDISCIFKYNVIYLAKADPIKHRTIQILDLIFLCYENETKLECPKGNSLCGFGGFAGHLLWKRETDDRK